MSGRGLLAAGILAAWGAGLGMLAQRQLSRTALDRLAESAIRISPGANYYVLEAARRPAGFASFTTDTITDGLQFTEYSVRDSLGAGTRVVRQTQTLATRALVVRQIEVTAGQRRLARLQVTGDSSATLVTASDSSVVAFAAPLLPVGLVPMAMGLGEDREVGTERAWTVFDPDLLALRPLVARIAAETTFVVVDSAAWDARTGRWLGAHADSVRAWRILEAGTPARLDAWVDEQGNLVRSAWQGLPAARTAYEIAFENWRPTRASVGDTALDSAPAPALKPSSLQALEFVALGLPFERLQATDERQRVSGDTMRVRMPSRVLNVSVGYWLPPHRELRERFARELKVEPGVESDHPYVVAMARALRRRESDPRVVLSRIGQWMLDSMRQEPRLGTPGAHAALRSRSGDASEHVLAFTALTRASGIPTRMVAGIVRTGDTWVVHPWAEVWLANRWQIVDPASMAPTTASYVRLMIAPPGVLPELERLVQRASLQVLREEPLPTRSRRTQ